MTLSLLAPAGLVALAALLVPLVLHLQRQSEARPTPFAALRWIGARLRPRRRVRFEELLLLLLRLLLVACVALLFAQPVSTGSGADKPWVGVSTALDPSVLRAAQSRADTTGASVAADAQWHWLAPGFPPIDAPRPAASQPLSSLVRDIDARLPARTPITVFVPGIIDGLDGERLQLSRAVDWRIVGSPASPPTASAPRPTPLVIRSSATRSADSRYLRAAGRALGKPLDSGGIALPLPANARQLAWLAPGPLPPLLVQWLRGGGVVVLDSQASVAGLATGTPAWRDHQGRVLAREASFGRGRVIQLQAALNAQAIPALLDDGFPARLERWLEPMPNPSRAFAAFSKPRTGGPGYRALPEPVDRWLAMLAVALLLIERWLATRAKRGLAA